MESSLTVHICAVAFKLFDLGGDEVIHKTELQQIMAPSFQNTLTEAQIDEIVASTFEEYGESILIVDADLYGYHSLCHRYSPE